MTGTVACCGELGERGVKGGARHDGVDEAADHAGRVGHRLVAAQVDLAGAQVLGVAAELGHAGLEADARAGGGMLEDHRQACGPRGTGVSGPPPVEGLQGGGQVEQRRAAPRA